MIRAAVFGPIPGTLSSLPAAAASRSSGSVLIPSACPSSRIRFVETPSSAATPTSSGSACASSSSSSAIRPVSTSSRSRVSMPGPIPASSRTRPCADERGDVRGCRADQLGRPAVRAHGVVAGAVQVEQGGERVEAVGEGRVVHD